MLINLYLFGNMILASISSSFTDNLKDELRRTLRMKRKKLEYIFHLIKSRVSKDGESPLYALSYENFSKLLKIVRPNETDLKIKTIFRALDFAGDNSLRNKIQISN